MRDPAWFDHAENVAAYAGDLIQSLHVTRGNIHQLLTALLFRRIASAFEAVLMLAERGMHTEGLAQRRSMLEALFVLGAVSKQPNLADTFMRNDQHRLLKIYKNIKKLPLEIQEHLPPEFLHEAIDEKIADLKLSTAANTLTTVSEYAKAADLYVYYLIDYSFASEAAHHVAKDLERQIILDQAGDVDGFFWGAEPDLPSELLSNAVDYMLEAVNATESLFEIGASETSKALRTKSNDLIELRHGNSKDD
jgi:hypothetical protein